VKKERLVMRFFDSFLVAGTILLCTAAAWSDDALPSPQPNQLPSLSSIPMPQATAANVNLSVTCYLGNPLNNETLGSITVNGASNAGPTCNSLFFACKGSCFGCYADFDLSEDICVDNAGRKFLR